MAERDSARSDPWDRLRGESAKAFAAFRSYLKLGPRRSIEKAAKLDGRGSGQYRRWSAKLGWVERAASSDAAEAREEDSARREAHREMVEQWRTDADQLRRLAMARFHSQVRRDPSTGELAVGDGRGMREAVATYRLHLQISQLIAAIPSEPGSEDGSEESFVRDLSDEELLGHLEQLRRRAREQEGEPPSGDQADAGGGEP